MHHLALVFGDIRDGRSVPVRLHIESVVDDVFGNAKSLDKLMGRMAKAGRGVIVYLREGSVGVAKPVREPGKDDGPMTAAENEAHVSASARAENWREIGLGAQILKDLGVASIKLISSKERRYVGLEGFGIQIEGTESLERC
jgi:3,4-dihydroxy 2-butanone 4-phosphate synthase/GTP cyclohydrolase II